MDGFALHRSAHRVGPVATATGSTETPSARCFSSFSSSSLRLPPPASRLRRRASNAPRYTVASDLTLCLHYAPGTQHHWAGALSSVWPIRCAATGFFCPALCRAPSFSYVVFCCLPYASVRCVLRSFVSFVSLPFPLPGTPPSFAAAQREKYRKCENAKMRKNTEMRNSRKMQQKFFIPTVARHPFQASPNQPTDAFFFSSAITLAGD